MKTDHLPIFTGVCAQLIILGLVVRVEPLDIRSCNSVLGMESGRIPDTAISASSSYVTNVGPRYGRLRKETAGGAWCPKRQIESGVREWLQVDFGNPHVVTAVQTQGRYDHGRGQEYVEEYTIEYRRPGFEEWREYKRWDSRKIFVGNSDTSTVVSHELVPPIFANEIRVLPHSIHRRTVCLRIELRGCKDESGVANYTIPESPVEELGDVSYDGRRIDGVLTDGLGRLIDGETGADNYRLDIGYGRGTGWVAWMRDSFSDDWVDLIFEFYDVKIFDAVHIYTNNYFSRHVQVFSRAEVSFTEDNEFYEDDEPLSYSYIPDIVLENARNVSIALHGRRARTIKLRLYFANRWIMISEIIFETSNPYENTTVDSGAADTSNGRGPTNPQLDLNLQTITAREEDQEYVQVLIGVLTAITLLLLLVFVIILLLSRRHKLQSSPTVLKNPFGFAVNMKDILLNLTPSSMLNDNGRASPEPPEEDASIHESLTMEQFDSPLVGSPYKATYAAVVNSDPPKEVNTVEILEQEASPGRTDSRGVNYPVPGPASSSSSPACSPARHSQHYRTLQLHSNSSASRPSTTSISSNYQRDSVDPANSKRWHTAPKEKHKVPAPIVSWNIAPSMNKPYKCKEIEPTDIPRECLRTVEKLGSSHIGEAIICESVSLDEVVTGAGRLVVARIPSTNTERANSARTSETMREVRFLSCLSDPNIARILGICNATESSPCWTIMEYTELGDLAHYLQYSVPLTGTLRPTCNLKALSQNCLLYMGAQIASGMRFLESKNLVHKDLAARNCLVGRCYSVKVTDIAMCSDLYKKDYSDIGGRPPAPIRWLPWESVLLDRYTCASSVWSFAVTLWEVMCLAREKPFQHLTNEQVIQNAEVMYYGGELQVLLPKPTMCPDEVYRVMCSCWKRDETTRPSFKDIAAFMKKIIADYRPTA
ncbi:discoidin domain-containing receptor 2-like [Venturia canescens]|uniref:discoidin domain-containing receptor 2-like n=1 Tax=Venturia canescens TaxID=32260 RepID=UPI001C9BC88D|nr:discoidin domain-containing receptor 2-like [Venturia canescens]